MPKLWVKNNGAWKQVQRLWIKDGGVWKSPTTASITQSGIGKQFYPDTTPTTTYAAAGTYSYTVPSGVTSLQLTYPTDAGMVSTTIAVTPGQVLPVVLGDYGVASSVGSTSIPAYSKIVFTHSAGRIDAQLTQTFSVATTSVANASTSGTNQSGSSTNLNVNGIYFATNSESAQGDWSESVTISTVPISTLIGTYRVLGDVYSSRGESPFYIQSTPSAANSWRLQFQVGEGGYSNYEVAFRIYMQQQGYVTIKPLNANVITYNSAGSYSFTVPAGITTVNAVINGGGGGNGGDDGAGPGYAGYPGTRVTFALSVTPGEVLSCYVGGGGGTGNGGTNKAGGTAGADYSGGSYIGGTGGNAGPSGYSGSGGGGGAATLIKRSSTLIAVAAGGGGGGGGDLGAPGRAAASATYNSTTAGANGPNPGGDTSSGGGGGGGYPYGGSAGSSGGGGGSYSGITGQSLVPSGGSSTSGTNGGSGSGVSGGAGFITFTW